MDLKKLSKVADSSNKRNPKGLTQVNLTGKRLNNKKKSILDSLTTKNLSDEQVEDLTQFAQSLKSRGITGDRFEDLVASKILEYSDMGFDEESIEEFIIETYNFYHPEKSTILDSVLDNLEADETSNLEVSPLEVVTQALNEYLAGDDSALEQLKTLKIGENEDAEDVEKEGIEFNEETLEENEDDAKEGDEEFEDDEASELRDSILNGGDLTKFIPKIKSEFYLSRGPQNRRLLEVTDSTEAPIEVPCTHAEFLAANPVPESWIGALTKKLYPSRVAKIKTFKGKVGDCLQLETVLGDQLWKIVKDDVDYSQVPRTQLEEKVNESCVPLESYYKIAAMVNGLNAIDPCFYKQGVTVPNRWYFDNPPENIDIPDCPQRGYLSYADPCATPDGERIVDLYGTSYWLGTLV